MKKNTILIFLLLTIHLLFAQGDYNKEHVIVLFRDGVLNKSMLMNTERFFRRGDLIAPTQLNDSLTKWSIGNTFRKVVRNARPDRKVSISRTGKQVSIPAFYNLMYLSVQENTDIPTLCKKLEKLPYVIYAEPDYYRKTVDAPAPDDPIFVQQHGWEQGNDRDIDLLRAWDFTRGSNNVIVGVLDGGIDYHNPDLGNGAFGAGAKVAGGYDYADNDSNPDDTGLDSHGSAVAGIIGAFANNATGVAGIAGGDGTTGNPGVQLISLRIGNDAGQIKVGDEIDAIYDAATSISAGGYGCHILNLSAGGYEVHNSERQAISYAGTMGVVFVAAKGNDDTDDMLYPADFSDNLVISVGASDELDQKAFFSNFGNNMDVVAPGTTDLLFSTVRVESGSYATFQGTSGAAPVVTGIAALLKSINIDLHRDDIENILELSADDVNGATLPGYDDQMGFGRVNAGRALELIHAPWVLQQHTAIGGISQKLTSGDGEGLVFWNDAGTTLPEGWYYGEMHQVTKTVSIPASACDEQHIWTRNVGATLGWSAANPNNNLGYCFIVSQTATTVTLRTFVYYIRYNSIGQAINAWFPTTPGNVEFAFTTLTNAPFTTDITGPSVICTSGDSFTMSTIPPSSTVTWQASPSNLFTTSSGSGVNAFLAAANSSTSGSATITFTINTQCDPVQVQNPFWVGKHNPTGFVSVVVDPWMGRIQAEVEPVPDASGFEWYLDGVLYTGPGMNNSYVSMPIQRNDCSTPDYSIGVKAINPCGTSLGYFELHQNPCYEGGFYYSYFPNPASETLTVERNEQDHSKNGGRNVSIENEATGPHYYRIYDSNSSLLVLEGDLSPKTEIDISKLNKGKYVLKIQIDNDTEETHHIIVD